MNFFRKRALELIGGVQVFLAGFAPLMTKLPPSIVPWVLAGSGGLTLVVAYIKNLPEDPK